jgi:hypothetical protein
MPLPPDGVDDGAPDLSDFDPDAVLERDSRVLLDPHFLGALHRELAETLPADAASVTLLRMGFLHGLQDALRAMGLGEAGAARACVPPLSIHCRIDPAAGTLEVRGQWPDRHEAEARLDAAGPSPRCDLSAGYTSGWLSAMFDADLLAMEERCGADGEASCHFVAREATAWRRDGGVMGTLAEAIPFAEYRNRVGSRAARRVLDELSPSGEPILESIDRDSACVHIWGPIMVIPFGGAEDGLRAIELIGKDPEAISVSVLILHLGNTVIDEAFGALALEQIVQMANAWGAEILFAEPSDLSERVIAELDHPPLLVLKSLEEAVAIGFQIARSQSYWV